MAVYKDPKTGNWRFRTWATNPFTKERRRLFGTPGVDTKKAAEEMERAHVEDFEKDPSKRLLTDRSTLIRDVSLQYLTHLKDNPELAASYTNKVALTFRHHIVPTFGERRLASITDAELQTFKSDLQRKPKGPNGLTAARLNAGEVQPARKGVRRLLAPRSIKDILRIFHGMFAFAFDRRLVGQVPLFPKPPKVFKKDPAFLNFEEADAVIRAASDPDERLAIRFAITTGLRAGEQMALHWEDIDWTPSREYLRVHRAFKLQIIGGTKGKAERHLDLDPDLVPALKANRKPRGLVFRRADGGRLTSAYLTYTLRKALKAADISKHIRWHDLRHTFGSHMAMLGIPLQQIQAWMGHASINTTEIYAHLCPSRGHQAMAAAKRARVLLDAEAPEPPHSPGQTLGNGEVKKPLVSDQIQDPSPS